MFLQDKQEFITADMADIRLLAEKITELVGHGLQKMISHFDATRFIDLGKIVDIQIHNGQRLAIHGSSGERIPETLYDQILIRKIGKHIVRFPVGDFAGQCMLLGDITQHHHRCPSVTVPPGHGTESHTDLVFVTL